MSETNTPEGSLEVSKSFPPSLVTRADAECALAIAATPAAATCPRQPDQILLMQEMERQRIAMDLHDGLGPLITLVKLELQNASRCIGASPPELGLARAAIRRAEENVARTFDELRRTVLDLRPAMLDDLGVLHALGWLIRRFELSGTDAVIQGRLAAEEGAVPVDLKIVIFRICQEALNNVMKHAHASHVSIALEIAGAQLQLSIVDDGVGFVTAAGELLNRSGGGLPGIIRRANSSNGECGIHSAAGLGTRITVRWTLAPLSQTGHAAPSGNDNPLPSIIPR
jgi:signal transduction histidine kinase